MKSSLLLGASLVALVACPGSPPEAKRDAGATTSGAVAATSSTASSMASATAAAPVETALPIINGQSFRDFCAAAVKENKGDALTLRYIEVLLGVRGCDELEKHLPKLTAFESGAQDSPFNKFSEENKQEITNLAPLAYAVHLRVLALPYKTPISDLGPLTNLKELTDISVDASKITDISPLRGHTKLREVSIRTTGVRDISALLDLPLIEELDIRNLAVPAEQIARFKAAHSGAKVLDGNNR